MVEVGDDAREVVRVHQHVGVQQAEVAGFAAGGCANVQGPAFVERPGVDHEDVLVHEAAQHLGAARFGVLLHDHHHVPRPVEGLLVRRRDARHGVAQATRVAGARAYRDHHGQVRLRAGRRRRRGAHEGADVRGDSQVARIGLRRDGRRTQVVTHQRVGLDGLQRGTQIVRPVERRIGGHQVCGVSVGGHVGGTALDQGEHLGHPVVTPGMLSQCRTQPVVVREGL